MGNFAPAKTTRTEVLIEDWASDKDAFKNVSWGKAMMWIFLLSDTFIFSCFLVGYMSVRMTTAEIWPNSSEVFALTIMGEHIPLILIAIMTFVLITSSGTMAMAVNCGYRNQRKQAAICWLLLDLGCVLLACRLLSGASLSKRGCVPGVILWAPLSLELYSLWLQGFMVSMCL